MTTEEKVRAALTARAEQVPAEPMWGAALRAQDRLRRRSRWSTSLSFAAATVIAVVVVVMTGSGSVRHEELGPAVTVPAGTAVADWPRRGDVTDPAVDRAAVAAWDRSLREEGVRRHGEARVLYAGGGDRPVVVLYGVADRGGDRLVVLTETAGALAVYADRPAPAPTAGAVTIVLDPPERLPYDDKSWPCTDEPQYDDTSAPRILVIGAPGVRSARWRIEGWVAASCPNSDTKTTAWQAIPLRGGAGIVPARLDRRGSLAVQVDGPRSIGGSPTVPGPQRGRYEHVVLHDFVSKLGGREPIPWRYRSDYSRAMALGEKLKLTSEITERYSACVTLWAVSLPDGTATVMCATTNSAGTPVAILAVEDADRRVRLHIDTTVELLPAAFATVVHGVDGNWLLVIGPPELTQATFNDGADRRPVPLHHGGGFLRLDRTPSTAAYVSTDSGNGTRVGLEHGTPRLLWPNGEQPY